MVKSDYNSEQKAIIMQYLYSQQRETGDETCTANLPAKQREQILENNIQWKISEKFYRFLET